MNIQKTLESEHSKKSTKAIVDYIGGDKKRFNDLLKIFLEGDYRLTQRSAWPLSYICIAHPELILPVTGKLVRKLNDKNSHPAIARNILRVFQEIDLPEKYMGPVLDSCIGFLKNETTPIAIKAFAISTAARISKDYEELSNELRIVLNEMSHQPQSAAIKVRIKSAFKQLAPVESKH